MKKIKNARHNILGLSFFLILANDARAFDVREIEIKPSYFLAQKGLQEKIKDFNFWLDLCNLQSESGKYEEALEACEKAITLLLKLYSMVFTGAVPSAEVPVICTAWILFGLRICQFNRIKSSLAC